MISDLAQSIVEFGFWAVVTGVMGGMGLAIVRRGDHVVTLVDRREGASPVSWR